MKSDKIKWLESIFNNTNSWAGVLDLEGRVLDANNVAMKFINIKIDDIYGKYLWETPWWKDPNENEEIKKEREPERQRVISAVKRAAKGECVSFEIVHVRRTGEYTCFEFTIEPLRNEKGEIIYLLPRGTDISEKKKLGEILDKSKHAFKTIFEKVGDANLLIKDGTIVDCNEAAVALFKVKSKDELLGKLLLEFAPHKQADGGLSKIAEKSIFERVEQADSIRYEWLNKDANGCLFFTENTIAKIELNEESFIYITKRDISERKAYEKELKNIGFYDKLTGLYNRYYYEEELNRIEIGKRKYVGVAVFDINGLKLTNDTLGHSAGDELIIAAGECIKATSRGICFMARIGGDEFVLLTYSRSRKNLDTVIEEIYENINWFNESSKTIILSVSVGTAICSNQSKIRLSIKEADEKMYRVKRETKSEIRNLLCKSWVNSLILRGILSEVRVKRLAFTVLWFSGKLGFTEDECKIMETFSRFHDVGLVAVPDKIILKEETLTEDEFAELKKHPEIGYRLAIESDDMRNFADWILKHHERWDGKGYPYGLVGENIPLSCRILSLADAYEAMISDCSFRCAITWQKALQDIKKWAGFQFDPILSEKFIKFVKDELNNNPDESTEIHRALVGDCDRSSSWR